eukprot:UN29309
MLLPANIVNLNLTLSSNIDVDIMVKDATDLDLVPLTCLIGPNCEITQPGTYTKDRMQITYSGDDTEAPVMESVMIPWTDRDLAYTVKARASGEATAYYEYDGVEPCTAQTGEC